MSKQHELDRFRPKLISIAVASCFVTSTALANPSGHTVVHGNVTVKEVGNLLKIHNSPNAVINWRSFSIGANEITRFIQESRNSVVMNRVVGSGGTIEKSVIDGALKSNGRVYLLNSSGVVFGAGSVVDVAGLVVSSLQLSDADFHANRLRFTQGAGAGNIENHGHITTRSGGEVYLVGPAVTNSGLITSPNGNVVLAAGNQVELVNPGTPNLRVEIAAPDNQAVNLGNIVAESGRIGIYAGLINNSGTIRADSAIAEGGRILLKAKQSVTLESSSVLDASGQGGGTIEVHASKRDGTVNVAGRLDASAPVNGDGGFVETSAATVNIADGTRVTTRAAQGETGLWLIDPAGDFIIRDPEFGGNISGATVSANLVSTNQTYNTTAIGGNLIVDESIPSWGNSNSLTLIAHNNVSVNQSIVNLGDGAIRMFAGWNGGSTVSPVVVNGTGDIVLNAPVRTGGDIFLIAGNQISQNGSGILEADGLLAKAGPGGVYLYSAANDVSRIAGEARNSFYFVNGRTLTVGSVSDESMGLSASGIKVDGSSAYVNLQVSGSQVSHLNVNQDVVADGVNYGQVNLYVSGAYGGDINVRNAAVRAIGDGVEGYVSLYGRTLNIENSTLQARGQGTGLTTLNLYAYGPDGVQIRNSTLEANMPDGSANISIATGVSGGNVLADGSTITAGGRSASILLQAYGGNVTVRGSTLTATGKTGADGGSGVIGISALNNIDTSGSTLRATGTSKAPEPPSVALVEVESGNIIGLSATEGDITLGFLSTNGLVAVQAGGKVIDGNDGANIAAPIAAVMGASGVGTLANPLETQVNSLLVGSEGGQIGIVNLGNLRLEALAFSGTDAAIGTTGTMTFGGGIFTPGNLGLFANNGMVVDRSIVAGGNLSLAAGAGDLGIFGVPVQGHNVSLQGNNILVGSTTGTAPTSVTADHLVKATSTLNFNVIGGANSGAYSTVVGENVDLTVGGAVNISAGSAHAQIESTSPTTVTLTFPNRSSGGFFVNGSEGVIYDEATNTGFLAAGQPAVLGQSLKVTYGGIPDVVQQLNDQNITNLDNAGEPLVDDKSVTLADTTSPEEKQEGKALPVCK